GGGGGGGGGDGEGGGEIRGGGGRHNNHRLLDDNLSLDEDGLGGGCRMEGAEHAGAREDLVEDGEGAQAEGGVGGGAGQGYTGNQQHREQHHSSHALHRRSSLPARPAVAHCIASGSLDVTATALFSGRILHAMERRRLGQT